VRTLQVAPVRAPTGESAIAPLVLDGLPAEIDGLGRRWPRKVEFHVTVIGKAVIDRLAGGDPGVPKRVAAVVAGRSVAPIRTTGELRHVRHPDDPELETIVAMVECPALAAIYTELSAALGADLSPPPAHVTLYSTDPERGIGINDERELGERAPELSDAEQHALRRAMQFDELFGSSSNE
jgi:hypothetical protein